MPRGHRRVFFSVSNVRILSSRFQNFTRLTPPTPSYFRNGFSLIQYCRYYIHSLILITHGPGYGIRAITSSTKAKYVAALSYCAQVLWPKQQLQDLGIYLKEIPIYYDNTSTISLAKNLVQPQEPSIFM